MANKQLTIGEVARRTGLSAKTIRFYEDEGCIPPIARGESGYRLYTEGDVWRLNLIRQLRLLGLPLAEARTLVTNSFDTECAVFANDLTALLERQKREIERQIAELEDLRSRIGVIEGHIDHCQCDPGATVGDCFCCSLLNEEGGDHSD